MVRMVAPTDGGEQMHLMRLGEVAKYHNGRAFKPDEWASSGLPIVRIQNLTSEKAQFNYYNGQVEQENLIDTGDLLISWSASLDAFIWTRGPAVLNQHIFKVVVDPKIIRRDYLYYIAQAVMGAIRERVHGSTMQHITRPEFENITIPVVTLSEQKRIASLLDKADRLRRLRRYALHLSDTYLQSVFIHMFGDPKTNPKRWDLATLGDVILSTKDGPHVSPEYTNYGVPFLSTRNVRRGEILWEDLKYVSQADAEQFWRNPDAKPARGDILYTKGGTTGLAAMVDFDDEIAVWVHIAVLKLQRNLVDPLWLENMLNSDYCYQQSQELTFGIVNRDLGLKRMPMIKLYLPPLSVQQEFAVAARKFHKLRAQQREALRQAEHLFQSLLHQAFTGALSRQDAALEHGKPSELAEPSFLLNAPAGIPHESLQQASLPFD